MHEQLRTVDRWISTGLLYSAGWLIFPAGAVWNVKVSATS